KTDLREADQVFTIYAKDFGKLKILGKAIRKIKSKLRPGAELFYLSEIEFIQGKNHKTLTDATAIEKFKNVKQDLEKLEIVSQIAEDVDDLIKGEEKDEQVWDLLNETFDKLNDYKLQTINPSTPSSGPRGYPPIYHYFVWNLLSILGYQMDLYHCNNCQKKLIPEKLYFNSEEGIVCSGCFEGAADKEISPEIIKILRLFLKKDWNILLRLKIQDFHKKELEAISLDFLKSVRYD
ncbi:DNA repair protein RecO, partial [Patescibacteria group bacterium]|nr:DNA repair protein RecO [Patescibacteria group bacterium]